MAKKKNEVAERPTTYVGSACKRGHSGLRYVCSGGCVECRKEKDKLAVRSEIVLERMRKASREWYLRNKDVRPDQQRARRLADIPAYKEQQQRYYQKHREQRLQRSKEYYENNKGKAFAKVARRRAIKAGAGGSHTEKDIARIFENQKGKCAACRTKLEKYHRDHIMPLALGGDNNPANIQLLCPTCNLKKNAKHPVDFMQEIGFLL